MQRDKDRWKRVELLFHAALERNVAQRRVFLDTACEGDGELLAEVESLLAHEGPDDFLNTPASAATHEPEPLPDRIDRYRILSKLGEGGMGVVYLAEDDRLGRRVALKLLRANSSDPKARERLIREARVAASILHPLICQVFELGESGGQPFITMELIAGEPLTVRLARAPLPPPEAVGIAISVADALGVLHRHGVVHRDLKPSNIFVTETGVKVLDFGLARSIDVADDLTATITQAGAFVGTPQYSAPEHLLGKATDARADLFSTGVILFQMLTGRHPFSGQSFAALVHAVLSETPPVLTGSPAIAAVDRILYRLLAKRPEDRYASAEALADDLRKVQSLPNVDRVAEARTVLRLAVLPFRLARPGTDIEYLSVSLADAVVSSLSGLESLMVRSTMKSARYATAVPDLNAIATELAVDVVLTGSILQVNDRLRVSAELVSAPGGDVLWTETRQVSFDQIFELHDQLAQSVVQSLPLTKRDQSLKSQQRPANTKAYELYLRGMQLRMESSSWRQARSLFEQCLALDPSFAPAWAEQGRLDRVLGKYEDPSYFARAESAFERALELDPENGPALHHYALLEIDLGRVDAAVRRLLKRVRQHRAEPHLYAALVQAYRYAGLLEESLAVHHQAKRLDPSISTSVLHTYYMKGDYARALEEAHQSSDPFEPRVLGALGRETEAIAAARREEERFAGYPLMRSFSTGLRAAFENNHEEAIQALQPFETRAFEGEGLFYVAQIYARLGLLDNARATLERAAGAGFLCLPAFERDPYLAPLRDGPGWSQLMERVRFKQQFVIDEFVRGGGKTLAYL
jgi:serine/threonine protein kinase